MLTKEEKYKYRSDLFRHLDGLVTAPTAYILLERGILDEVFKKKRVDLSTLASTFNAHEGYLNVALRVLASQGWLDYSLDHQTNEVFYAVNEKSATAFKYCELYKDVVDLLKKSAHYHPRIFNKDIYQDLKVIFRKFQDNYGIVFF